MLPRTGPVARMEILRYHSRNKPLESQALLSSVAEVTQVREGSSMVCAKGRGYGGAEIHKGGGGDSG